MAKWNESSGWGDLNPDATHRPGTDAHTTAQQARIQRDLWSWTKDTPRGGGSLGGRVVTAGIIVAIVLYVVHATQPTTRQSWDNVDLSEAKHSSSMAYRLAEAQLPPPCNTYWISRSPRCSEVMNEFTSEKYGILECKYDLSWGRVATFNYWYKDVPPNAVRMARLAPVGSALSAEYGEGSIKELGDKALRYCPATADQARSLSSRQG
jgi:hypothetical protein